VQDRHVERHQHIGHIVVGVCSYRARLESSAPVEQLRGDVATVKLRGGVKRRAALLLNLIDVGAAVDQPADRRDPAFHGSIFESRAPLPQSDIKRIVDAAERFGPAALEAELEPLSCLVEEFVLGPALIVDDIPPPFHRIHRS